MLNEGLFLNPSKAFIANLGVTSLDSDADSAIGFGPSIDLTIGELGAELNFDVDQEIKFTLQKIDGVLS